MDESKPKFEHWAVIEIMGHSRAAGRVTEENVAGTSLLRVDIPTDAHNFRTVYYGGGSIFAMHVTDEETARRMASRSGATPPFAYEIQAPAERPVLERFSSDRDDELNF